MQIKCRERERGEGGREGGERERGREGGRVEGREGGREGGREIERETYTVREIMRVGSDTVSCQLSLHTQLRHMCDKVPSTVPCGGNAWEQLWDARRSQILQKHSQLYNTQQAYYRALIQFRMLTSNWASILKFGENLSARLAALNKKLLKPCKFQEFLIEFQPLQCRPAQKPARGEVGVADALVAGVVHVVVDNGTALVPQCMTKEPLLTKEDQSEPTLTIVTNVIFLLIACLSRIKTLQDIPESSKVDLRLFAGEKVPAGRRMVL